MDTAISAIKQRVAVQVAAVRDIVQQPPFSIQAVGTVVAELAVIALVIHLTVWLESPIPAAIGSVALYTISYLWRKKSTEQLGHGQRHCLGHHHTHHCGHCYHGGNGGHGGHGGHW